MSEKEKTTKHIEFADVGTLAKTAEQLNINLTELSRRLGLSSSAVPNMIHKGKCKKITALACAALVKDDTHQRIILIPCSKSDVKGLRAYATAVGLKSLEIST